MWGMVTILYLKDVSFDNHCLLQTKWENNKHMKCASLFFWGSESFLRFLHFKLAFYYLFFFPLPLDIYIFSLLEFSIYLTLCGVFFLFVCFEHPKMVGNLTLLWFLFIFVLSFVTCFWLSHGTWRYHLRNLDGFELLSTRWGPELCLCTCQRQMLLQGWPIEVEKDSPTVSDTIHWVGILDFLKKKRQAEHKHSSLSAF